MLCLSVAWISGLSVMNSKGSSYYLQVFTTNDIDSKVYFQVKNNTVSVMNEFVVCFSNTNMTIFVNGAFQSNSSSRGYFQVTENDFVEIYYSDMKFIFTVDTVTDDLLIPEAEQIISIEEANKQKWAIRIIYPITFILSIIVVYVFQSRKRKLVEDVVK